MHYEFHPNQKNSWGCEPVCANPQPTIDHQAGGGGGGGSTGDSTYPTPTSNKVFVSKLVQGQMESDSVWYLQRSLNQNGNPPEGASLPLTGNFLDQTAAAVKGCQQAHGFGDDPMGSVYVGPSQAAHLFDGWGLEVIYDTGNPSPPDTEEPPPDQGSKPEAPAIFLPGAIWDPISKSGGGYFTGLRPFTGTAKKVTLHTTQTTVKPNWEVQQSGIPHLTIDLITGQRWQHLDFGIAAYTLSGGTHSPNSDSGQNIQIELIGYAEDTPTWDQAQYDELRQILEWLGANLAIPYQFPYLFTGNAGYGENGEVRLTWAEWEQANGILGHSHAPYNSHWDPGHVDVSRLTQPTEPEQPAPGSDAELRAALIAGLIDIHDALGSLIRDIEELG